ARPRRRGEPDARAVDAADAVVGPDVDPAPKTRLAGLIGGVVVGASEVVQPAGHTPGPSHGATVGGGPGETVAPSGPSTGAAAGSDEVGESMLAQFAVDLTARARAGRLDPVIGREDELRRIMEILGRRRKNNPVLIGEPGVGKTA